MIPKTANLQCYRGQTFRRMLTFRTKQGSTVDLTGATCKAQIRRALNAKQLVAEFDCHVDGTAGTVTLSLESPVTAEIPPGDYVYDIKTTLASQDVKYFVSGKFSVSGRVTE